MEKSSSQGIPRGSLLDEKSLQDMKSNWKCLRKGKENPLDELKDEGFP